MKSLKEFIFGQNKDYGFKIRIRGFADLDKNHELLDRIEHALRAYDLQRISTPKKLPYQSKNSYFPNAGTDDIFLIDVSLAYPTTDDVLRSTIASQGRIPLNSISVVSKDHPEEIWREAESTQEDPIGDVQQYAGQKRTDSLLKELGNAKKEREAKTAWKGAK